MREPYGGRAMPYIPHQEVAHEHAPTRHIHICLLCYFRYVTRSGSLRGERNNEWPNAFLVMFINHRLAARRTPAPLAAGRCKQTAPARPANRRENCRCADRASSVVRCLAHFVVCERSWCDLC